MSAFKRWVERNCHYCTNHDHTLDGGPNFPCKYHQIFAMVVDDSGKSWCSMKNKTMEQALEEVDAVEDAEGDGPKRGRPRKVR